MKLETVEMICNRADVLAELNTGEVLVIATTITALADYREYYEPPRSDMDGEQLIGEYDIKEDTVKAVYNDEFLINNKDDYTGRKISRILKVYDADWELKE